jgi:hypothetical protein
VETTVAPDGRFHFTDLNPSTTYCLAAGGAGLLQRERVRARPEDPEVVLELDYGYFSALRLVEADGTPVAATRCSGEGANQSGQLYEEAGSVFHGPRLSAWLSGVDIEFGEAFPVQRLDLGVADTRLPAIGPLVLHGRLPGYEPYQVDLDLLPIESSDFVPRDLVLQRSGGGAGSVEIQWEGLPEGAGGNWTLSAFLDLLSPSGGTLRYPMEISPGGQRVEPVRAGRHQVCVRTPDGFRHPVEGWLPLEVRALETTYLRVPMQRTGSLELRLFDRDGAPFTGDVRLMLGTETGEPVDLPAELAGLGSLNWTKGSPRTTVGPPYRFDGLPAGPREPRPEFPTPRPRRVHVEITPGETTVVELRVE